MLRKKTMFLILVLKDSLTPYKESIGFWAAVLTTASFAPQVFRTWRSGGDGLSWTTLALFGSGVGLWFVYGWLRTSGPIMLANGLTGLEVIFLIALKAWYAGRRPGRWRQNA